MKQTIIKTFKYEVQDMQIGANLYNMCMWVDVIEETHSFLFFKWKTYKTKEYVPYIKEPFYDGEYNTNRRLNCLIKLLRRDVDAFILECQNNKYN